VWQVLTDYESLPSFIPGLAKSVVRERQGNRLVLEQTGEARFLLFWFPIEVRYEVIESPPQWISSRAISGNLRRMNGRYELHPGPPRTGAPPAVLLRYEGAIEPSFELPPLIGMVALRSMAEQQFTAMVAEIERRAAAQGASK
jgi:ribosome-associated toxin RatA of RatAB toxin-antitoxin module